LKSFGSRRDYPVAERIAVERKKAVGWLLVLVFVEKGLKINPPSWLLQL
jgi:hypothetical protein